MKLGREIIQEELRMLDKLILDYRDKEIFVPKDFQATTIKTKQKIYKLQKKSLINNMQKTIFNWYCLLRFYVKNLFIEKR